MLLLIIKLMPEQPGRASVGDSGDPFTDTLLASDLTVHLPSPQSAGVYVGYLQRRCCWLGDRKGIRPVKTECWHGCLFGARYRLAYGPADATATHCLLVQ